MVHKLLNLTPSLFVNSWDFDIDGRIESWSKKGFENCRILFILHNVLAFFGIWVAVSFNMWGFENMLMLHKYTTHTETQERLKKNHNPILSIFWADPPLRNPCCHYWWRPNYFSNSLPPGFPNSEQLERQPCMPNHYAASNPAKNTSKPSMEMCDILNK